VSADKMNVFYIGVDNPVTISVPGVANEKVRASISNGSLSPTGGGHYNVRVTGGAEAVINVSADMDGSSRPMGSTKFRVKPIPTPIPKVANKISGNFTKAEILGSPYVLAVLENFDFDLRYNVISFKFTYKNPAGDLIDIPGQGYMLNQQMKNLIQNSRRGDRFWVEDIIAAGPTGNKQIGSVTIRITQ
ncbi:MAG TPA: GldM family protein, partial [Bacteroidales bacterium]|nr:GldM family protein [Bacteroidales bacterium]